jgi:hypothetical protein
MSHLYAVPCEKIVQKTGQNEVGLVLLKIRGFA